MPLDLVLAVSHQLLSFRPKFGLAKLFSCVEGCMKRFRQSITLGLSTTFVLLFFGCATIINGRHAEVAIKSQPAGAQVSVQNEKGETVATSKTPSRVTLKRSNGLFRKAPRYTAFIEKPGYETAQVSINPKWNPWILGNVVIGGIVGLAADSATGAIWRYAPAEIDRHLDPLPNENYAENGAAAISVVNHEAEAATEVRISD
jgi:hypothetical protein